MYWPHRTAVGKNTPCLPLLFGPGSSTPLNILRTFLTVVYPTPVCYNERKKNTPSAVQPKTFLIHPRGNRGGESPACYVPGTNCVLPRP